MTIIFNDICKSYNGKNVFEGISGKICDGDKIGLIGINGVGKTTLLKILIGSESFDLGKIKYLPQNLKIGYLNQFISYDKNSTVYDELYKSKLMKIDSSYNNDSYRKKVKDIIKNVGISEFDMNQKTASLSGGEKTKLSICKVLMEDPDILFLDEPTNHLDVDSINWLENFLNRINKTVLIISHDRQFLDNTVNKILLLKYDCLRDFRGNYSDFKLQIENERINQENTYNKQQSEIKHLKEVINDRKSWFDKAHNAAGQNDFLRSKAKKHVSVMRSKEKQLERLEENKVSKPKDDITAAFEIINKKYNNKKLPKYLVEVKDLDKSFNSKEIFRKVSFNIKKGDKIALVGKNGAGKTTLIKIMLGKEQYDSGSVYINASLSIGYFSQELEQLNMKETIIDNVINNEIDQNSARLMLGCLLFKGEDVFKKVENLSMGEKCRVAFAKLILQGSDMLILDEPTNYMDITSREKIEEVIEKYQGTMFLVSHDRYLLNRVSNRIFEITDLGIDPYDGNYKDYEAAKIKKVKENSIEFSLRDTLDEISRLECEIAFISGKLDNIMETAEEKEKLNKQFVDTAKRINYLKSLINI